MSESGGRGRKAGHWAWRRLREKDLRYWITALLLLAFTTTATPHIYSYLGLTGLRAKLFEWLATAGPRPLEPRFIKVVLIGDDDYWRGQDAGRRPIDRNLLADLVRNLSTAGAHVIALDFDLRLPDPDATAVPALYQDETKNLITAIVSAAQNGHKIVLSKTIWVDAQGNYIFDRDAYAAYGLCTDLDAQGNWQNPGNGIVVDAAAQRNISCGYIALPYDEIGVPGQLRLGNGKYLDSFALAVAQARNYGTITTGTTLSYGDYIPEATWRGQGMVLSSHAVLQPGSDLSALDGQTVIVGADWYTLAVRRGDLIDVHATPVGPMIGALIHANFAEALLDSRTYRGTSATLIHGAELVFGLLAAAVFALAKRLWTKLAAVVVLLLLLLLIQWSALHLMGVFFDGFVPLLALLLHSFYERLFA
jgi:CHASE2 domain-containing sensor protein